MKNILAVLALAALMPVAQAQTNNTLENGGAAAGANSAAGSSSDSRAVSGSAAIGNAADTRSGAAAGSTSTINMTVEASQPLKDQSFTNRVINSGETTSNVKQSGELKTTQDVRYSGEVRNVQEIHQSGTTTVKTAPGIAMSGPASGPCTGMSGGIGASWLGGGLGANFASVERSCTLRENARMMAMILPSTDGPEKEELRNMMMSTLRTLYNESIAAPKK